MASKLAMLAKLADMKDLTSGIFGSDEKEPEPPSEKELKEEEKRKEAQKLAEEERKKAHLKQEYQREKVRENIRQKYGIEKKASSKDKVDRNRIAELAKDYGLDEDTTKEWESKVKEDAEQREASKQKIEKKLETRRKKKEMKEKCHPQ
eukprot:TRINITY_DN5532_c0_g1_i1.p1 TRINITY_DN5532_c0_g1~~TRINITY_DN5532_c0_g1_i1.p1  ORF type:complete len:149 (-),score=53.91 TRINITY_DN5532_c0_g1_i1:144-590(-)